MTLYDFKTIELLQNEIRALHGYVEKEGVRKKQTPYPNMANSLLVAYFRN